jgi:photosystem II stability/assembly factor-like uncharacterized protein
VDPTLIYPDRYRDVWTLPLVFSHRDPRVLYFSHQRMFRTEDGGEHWTVISPDLTRENPGTPANLDPVTAANADDPSPRRGVIYAIAPSRLTDHYIWAGTDDGLIWRSRDEGAHWTDVTPPALTPWSKVGIIDTSHFDAETAYAAVDRHRLDDFKPYIYRTHDGGKSWQPIAAGIPDGSFVNAVREDPVRKGLLYAGTEKGVYVSFDDGDHWQPLQANLPVTSVRDIDVHGDDVVIATHGRAFWVLDDVTPLRELGGSGDTAGATRLFAPAAAVRFRPAGFTGTPMPKDEAMAANPEAGAFLDYVLKSAAKEVILEIRDEQGGLVRRSSSADPAPPPDLTKITVAPQWVPPPAQLSTAPGMHRFVWPLRYAAPAALATEGRRGADGPWAPPGRYTAVLEVDGERFTQPLTVVPDPRITMKPEDYARQFALARRIEEARAQVAAALQDAATYLKTLPPQNDTLRQRAEQITGLRSAGGPSPSRTLDSLSFVGETLDKLDGAVDGADAPPSPDAVAGFEKVQPKLAAALAAWEAFKAKQSVQQ